MQVLLVCLFLLYLGKGNGWTYDAHYAIDQTRLSLYNPVKYLFALYCELMSQQVAYPFPLAEPLEMYSYCGVDIFVNQKDAKLLEVINFLTSGDALEVIFYTPHFSLCPYRFLRILRLFYTFS
jgi:hypothetical protein